MSLSKKAPSVLQTNQQLEQKFSALTTALINLLAKEGVKNQPHLEGLPCFSKLNDVEKEVAIQRVETYYQLCSEHVAEGQSLRDSKTFTWRALVKMGLAPLSDFLNNIGDDDIVEIYSYDEIQMFRNLEFFDLCTYTLEELFCLQWYRLFVRAPEIAAAISNIAVEIFSKKHPHGLFEPLPPHIVTQPLAQEKVAVDFLIRYIGPLYQDKQVPAIICIERATPIK